MVDGLYGEVLGYEFVLDIEEGIVSVCSRVN